MMSKNNSEYLFSITFNISIAHVDTLLFRYSVSYASIFLFLYIFYIYILYIFILLLFILLLLYLLLLFILL